MNKNELINILNEYPDNYQILIGAQGYDTISVDVDDDYELITIEGFFSVNSEYSEEEIQEHNEALQRAKEIFEKVKYER